jgi:hypothetical protein
MYTTRPAVSCSINIVVVYDHYNAISTQNEYSTQFDHLIKCSKLIGTVVRNLEHTMSTFSIKLLLSKVSCNKKSTNQLYCAFAFFIAHGQMDLL